MEFPASSAVHCDLCVKNKFEPTGLKSIYDITTTAITSAQFS